MKKNSYLIWMVVIIVGFIALTYALPKRLDWNKTLYHEDKIPFGAYVFHDLVDDVVGTDTLITTRQSISQVFNERQDDDPLSMIIISKEFITNPLEVSLIKEKAGEGNNFLITAESFYGGLLDTLGLREDISFGVNPWTEDGKELINQRMLDVTSLHPDMKGEQFVFRAQQATMVFAIDSAADVITLAETNSHEPVAIYCPIGKGSVTVVAAPITFTNYNLLKGDNYKYALLALSGLPQNSEVVYNNHFLLGGSQANTSFLRYFRSNPALFNTWYLVLSLLIIFAIFHAKRRQRVIPIINPPKNTSLEFTETIGRLYYQRGDHANIARKKIDYFLEYVRTHYYLNTTNLDGDFAERLIKKSGKPVNEINELMGMIRNFRQAHLISQKDLLNLNNKIERFYN